MSELQKKMNEVNQALAKLRKVVFSNLANWAQVSSIAMGETVLIDETFNTKIYEDDTCMMFKTTIPPGVVFPRHFHDFLEQNLVLSGELKDGKKNYQRSDWMIYEPYEGHEIKNVSNTDSSIIVIFTK